MTMTCGAAEATAGDGAGEADMVDARLEPAGGDAEGLAGLDEPQATSPRGSAHMAHCRMRRFMQRLRGVSRPRAPSAGPRGHAQSTLVARRSRVLSSRARVWPRRARRCR